MKEYYKRVINDLNITEDRIHLLSEVKTLTTVIRAFFDVGQKIVIYFNNLNCLNNEAIIYSITNFLNRDGELFIKYSDDNVDLSMLDSIINRKKVNIQESVMIQQYNFMAMDGRSLLFQEDVNSISKILKTFDPKLTSKFLRKFEEL